MTEFRESARPGLWLGATRRHYEICDSSNERMWTWIAEGAMHGAMLRSDQQTLGRGRQGRSWISEAGRGLYVSYFLQPTRPRAEHSALALVVGIALCDLCRFLELPDVGLKWPNDLLCEDRKLAGVLVESRAAGQLVAGIGINLRPPRAGWPTDTHGISLAELDRPTRAEHLAEQLCEHLAERYQSWEAGGFGALRVDYGRFDRLKGRRIRYSEGERSGQGVADGVDDDGSLWIDEDGGERRRLHAGEVHLGS